MVFDVSKVGGIGEFVEEKITVGEGVDAEEVTVYKVGGDERDEKSSGDEKGSENATKSGPRAFLVVRKNTLEVRTDSKLRDLLREKYESVMESRYFGKGGIEIVDSGQLETDEINDLIRLSYKMSEELK